MEADEQARRARGLQQLRASFSNSEEITEYRVVSPFNPDFSRLKNSPRKYKTFPVIARYTPSKTEAQSLAELLSNPSSYLGPGKESTCLPDPGYIVAFTSNGASIDVVVCFACGDVWINGVPALEHTTFAISPAARKALLPRLEVLARASAA